MTEAELTLEERKHLYNMVYLVFLVVFFSFLICVLYIGRNVLPWTGWNILIWFGLPYSIIGPTTVFLSYEVFYPKRVRKSRMFHVKRFARRTVSFIVVILSFAAVTSVSSIAFSKMLGDSAFFPGMALWAFGFSAIVFLWLRRQNSRARSSL